MAAGLGFKDFVTGEVLTAADVDGYLMQGIWVFDDAAARDAAVTSPQEGNFAFLKDTNVTTYYTGSAWANLDTTGMTNPMTTTGDTIYSSSGSTPARLGIGGTGDVLTVAGGVPSWAAPASGGGMTLLSTTALSGTSTTVSSISQDYVNLFIVVKGLTFNSNAKPKLATSGDPASFSGTTANAAFSSDDFWANRDATSFKINIFNIPTYTATSTTKAIQAYGGDGAASGSFNSGGAFQSTTGAISQLTVTSVAGTSTMTAGSILIYGVN